MADKCTKCKINLTNATGIVCDDCMMADGGGMVVDAPITPQQIEPVKIPTPTDFDNDKYDSFDKEFENNIKITIIINYTKNFSEIDMYQDGVMADTKTYTDKKLFETELSALIKKIEDAEVEAKKREEERVKYFEGIKSVVGDLGFTPNK